MIQMSLKDKIAVVTGASQGIGAATAEVFASHGGRVVLLARSADFLAEVARGITESGGIACPITCDVSDPEQVSATFHQIADAWGPIDILVNAAGKASYRPFIDMDLSTWDSILATNLRGTMLCCHQAFRQMAGRGGVIINISSLAGVKNVEKFPGSSAYVTSKFGVAGLTEVLSIEGKPLNIRVMAVSPGAVDTPMLREVAPHLKPGMTPSDMAQIILFMVSNEGRFLHGTNVEIFSNE
jgi:NAD(P)-dependent dehydrogenase (short-subunit alcohol dehydrogenase family)